MQDNSNYLTYIFVSPKKLIINVNTEFDKKVYESELIITDNTNEINFKELDYFLNENIFKIEKKFQNFINKVFVILELENFFSLDISVKNNFENIVNLKNIKRLLYDAKDYSRETLNDKKIIHIIINKYQVDKKYYSFLPKNISCKSFSLDVNFLCISNDLFQKLEKILKKYQISINRIVSSNYIKKFLSDQEKDIFLIAKKIINGHNPNEAILVNKASINKGFFEKFFNFFS